MAQSSSKLILAGWLADGLGGEAKADQAILVTGIASALWDRGRRFSSRHRRTPSASI